MLIVLKISIRRVIIKNIELLQTELLIYQVFKLNVIENATINSERSNGRFFLESKLFGSKHLGKDRNLEQSAKL